MRVSIGMTEPGGGTDVLGAMRTNATKVEGGWSSTARRSGAPRRMSPIILVLARSDKNVEKRHQGLTLFSWTRNAGRFRHLAAQARHARHGLLLACTSTMSSCPTRTCSASRGKAWYMLLPTLNNERIMVGAFCLGVIDGVLEDALDT